MHIYNFTIGVESSEALKGFASGCTCIDTSNSGKEKGPCKPNTCQCMKEMHCRAPYTPSGTLALSPGFPIYECNHLCKYTFLVFYFFFILQLTILHSCGDNCHNRLIQKGSNAKLAIFKTLKKGWGVRAIDYLF